MRTIGIVGGAGPMAGALLFKKIVQICQRDYGCVNDADYPKILLLSFPFSEMLKPGSLLQKEGEVAMQLKNALDFLAASGADIIGIACNTLHAFLDPSAEKVVNIIEEAEKETGLSKTLLLCTGTSTKKNLYDLPSKILPDCEGQVFTDRLIRSVLKGDFAEKESRSLEDFILSMKKRDPSIEAVLLGCSELSVLHDAFPLNLPSLKIIDPLDLLAARIVKNFLIIDA